MEAAKKEVSQHQSKDKQPQLKLLNLEQKRKDAERARLMLLGVSLQLRNLK